ncbi:MAG: magnesium chelatase, partial [Chitinophagaceae bacterium]|nr:magnesium chelatase [Chitinophagaceae bacterium]
FQVAMNLVEKAIRSQFINYFPNPDTFKKRRGTQQGNGNPYSSVQAWFDKGNSLNILFNLTDEEKLRELYRVDGLHAMVKKHFKHANDSEAALLMEFVLHGLSAYSIISKRIVDNKIEFKDLMGSMLNLGPSSGFSDEDMDKEDFN